MQITIKASVGALGHNRPLDVMNTKAAINVYFRSVKKPALEVYAGFDQELVDAIKYVQEHALNLSQIDGLIRPGDTVAKWLVSYWSNSFKAAAVLKPKKGLLTWEAEGHEGGPNHSRKLHIPDKFSGLTIGRGYDCSKRDPVEIVKDLSTAGVPGDIATLFSQAAKLRGENAIYFVIRHDLLDWEISLEAQVKLFELIYPKYEATAKRVYTNFAKGIPQSFIEWNDLKQALQDIFTDIVYRGDYIEPNRKMMYDAVHENEMKTALEIFSDRSKWSTVPPDRFKRRVDHLKKNQ